MALSVTSSVSDLPLGAPMFWGLGGIRDFEPPRFIDWIKQARRWNHDGVYLEAPYLDANGDLVRLPTGGSSYAAIVVRNNRYDLDDGPRNMKITWNGDATVSVLGTGVSSVDTSVSGQITFVFNAAGTTVPNLDVRVTPTTVDGSGNISGEPIRVFCIDTAYETEWNAGEIFLPYQVEPIDSACLGGRFMDWLETNGNTLVSWADRPKMTDATYAGDGRFASEYGCPIELCIAWCNRFQKHMWFNLPVGVDDEYITNAATLIRDTLDSNLHVYPALSNEIWNDQFTQKAYAKAQALADFGSEDHWTDWQSKRSTEMAVIFRDVFSAQLDRLHPQIESQQTGTSVTTALLYPSVWQAAEPETYVDPKAVHDGCAVSGYFYMPTFYSVLSDVEAAAIWTAFESGEAAAIDALMGYLSTGVDQMITRVEAQFAIIRAAGLRMTTYEAQSHVPLNYADDTVLYQRDLRVEDAEAFIVGETLSIGGVDFEVLSKAGQILTVTPGVYPSVLSTVTGETSEITQRFVTIFNNIDASGYIIGETVTQTGAAYSITGEVLPGTGGTSLVVAATSGTGTFWRLAGHPDVAPIIGQDSEASQTPQVSSDLHQLNLQPRPGIYDMWQNAYNSAAYGAVLTDAIARYRAAGGTIWNQFVDMSRGTAGGCWNTMDGYSDRDSGLMQEIRAYCAANPRNFPL